MQIIGLIHRLCALDEVIQPRPATDGCKYLLLLWAAKLVMGKSEYPYEGSRGLARAWTCLALRVTAEGESWTRTGANTDLPGPSRHCGEGILDWPRHRLVKPFDFQAWAWRHKIDLTRYGRNPVWTQSSVRDVEFILLWPWYRNTIWINLVGGMVTLIHEPRML